MPPRERITAANPDTPPMPESVNCSTHSAQPKHEGGVGTAEGPQELTPGTLVPYEPVTPLQWAGDADPESERPLTRREVDELIERRIGSLLEYLRATGVVG